jgi:hypothetical protein
MGECAAVWKRLIGKADVQAEQPPTMTQNQGLTGSTTQPKYKCFVQSNLLLVCRDSEKDVSTFEKMFSWIFDLRDRECKEWCNVLDNPLLCSLLNYTPEAKHQIRRLRKQLTDLQMTMVNLLLYISTIEPASAVNWPNPD